ncbi:SCO0607 family lipoprotein [Streptomyces galbus]|uniref:SCO0607 family lipoprotein n=1 Tax=Streptomyces galbus TaxID=33898 RepID=UPI0037877114
MRMSRRAPGTAAAPRTGTVRAVAAVLASAAALVALTGCAGFEYREHICSDGEYPALNVGTTGSTCVPEGEAPPAGYVKYPRGKVPQEVDDKWDKYWRTHTLDENGRVVDAPAN